MKLNELVKHIAEDQSIVVLDYRTFKVLEYPIWINKMDNLMVDVIDVVDETIVIHVH